MRGRLLFLGGTVGLALAPRTALAHAFGERYDLPVPLGYWLAGAGAAVLLSFLVAALFLRGRPGGRPYPRLLLPTGLARALAHPALWAAPKALSDLLLGLVVATGLLGSPDYTHNLSPTFVWVVFTVGFSYLVALAGDLWALVNPWKVAFEAGEGLLRLVRRGRSFSPPLRMPAPWGVWPAFLLFFGFLWAENAFPDPALPRTIAVMALVYSAITWLGMALFGKEAWLARGEAFSVFFRLLGRFGVVEVEVPDRSLCEACPLPCREGPCINCPPCARRARERVIALRPPGMGLLFGEGIGLDRVAFLLLMLSSVTFDGFNETPAWRALFLALLPAVPLRGYEPAVLQTLGLVLFLVLLLWAYDMTARIAYRLGGGGWPWDAFRSLFAFTLVPISIGYQVAHYSPFLLLNGQLLIPLLSDPFGWGWDLLGTAGYRMSLTLLNARVAWLVGVGAIVLGHILAVLLAHLLALRGEGDHRRALRGQVPLVALMVGYTVLSLWIIAQPIVE